MSRIDSAINIDDLKRMARRRLPKIMFDFIEGGAEPSRRQRRRVRAHPRYNPAQTITPAPRNVSVSGNWPNIA